MILQVIFQGFVFTAVKQEISQQGNTPCSAFSRCFHYSNRRVNGGGKVVLTDSFGFKQAAVAVDTVNRHILPVHDLHAVFQGFHAGINLGAHEIGQIHTGIRKAYKEGTAFRQSGDGLTGQIIEIHQSAAVLIALQGFPEELCEDITGLCFDTQKVRKLPEKGNPGIDITCTAVAVNHTDLFAGRRGDNIDFGIDFAHGLFQDDHAEDGSTGADIARSFTNAVRGGHTRSGVTFRGTERASGFQVSGRIQQQGALFCQGTGILAGTQHFRQDIDQLPGISLVSNQGIKSADHPAVIGTGIGIDGHHTAGITNTQHFTAAQEIMDPAGKGGQIGNILYVALIVQDRLVKMAEAPALRHVEGEQIRKRVGRLAGNGVAPGAERNQEIHAGIEGEIAMHHGTDAKSADFIQCDMIFILYVFLQIGIAGL